MAQKVAYVTGGMGGIGTAICQRLHKEGFKVIAGCGPSRDHVKWIGEQKALGYTFYASVGNVADWESTVEAERRANVHIHDGVTEHAFVVMRSQRDADLAMPTLILPAVQINIRAGAMPPVEANGQVYLKLPLNVL